MAGLFQRVAAKGPHDPTVWRKLTARADVIAHSLTSRQAALILSAMSRVQHREESFLRRFSVKFAPSLVENAELLDLCGIISSLSQLNAYCEETFDVAAQRAARSSAYMDAKQLSLVLNAFARVKHKDTGLFRALLRHVPRRLKSFTARDLAVLLNAVAQLPGLAADRGGQPGGPDPQGSEERLELDELLEAVALRLPGMLQGADLHSLALILNAFAQLQFIQKDALDLISEELLSGQRLERATPRQLAMILNAAAKLQVHDPGLLDALASSLRQRARSLDAQGLCMAANASAKLGFGVETFQTLYAQVPRRLGALSGRQLAMLCHAWAKAHIHNDDLFSLLALPLTRHAGSLTAHEIAMTVYGFAHFRKAPSELFGPLLERFTALLSTEVVSDRDLIMLSNALGRVNWRDEGIADALRRRARLSEGSVWLAPGAADTFGLQDLAIQPS